MEAAASGEMTLLEPILDFELRVQSTVVSKALYDLRLMNANLDGTNLTGQDSMCITGQIPADLCRGYAAKVGSYTEGRGSFLTKFGGYRETDFNEEKVNAGKVNPGANAALYVMQKIGAR